MFCLGRAFRSILIFCSLTIFANAQGDDPSVVNTMRPVIRGRTAAVSSMKAEATEAARRILHAGGIPGVVDGWYIILDRWGTMSFEQVLQPAIDLAENGFPLSERLSGLIAESQEKISKYPSTVRIYLPDGKPPKAGAIFRNPD